VKRKSKDLEELMMKYQEMFQLNKQKKKESSLEKVKMILIRE